MKGKHEGLITLETYTRIQQRIHEGARVAARADINKDFPLRGFALCGDCEKPLTSCWSKSKTGDKHPYYMCFNKGCGSYRKSIRRAVIEGEFADLLRDVAPSPAKLSLAKRMFTAAWNERQDRARENAALYASKIGELDKQVETLLSRLIEADTSTVVKAYEKKIAELEHQKLLLAEKAQATGKPRAGFEQMFELAVRFPANLWKVWETGRFDLQRLVLKHVDLEEKCVRQNPREVATKFGKAIDSFFHKGFPEAEAVLAKWITYLDEVALFGPDDPLFPATAICAKGTDGFKATGFERRHWSTTEPIRKIVNAAFKAAGLAPFGPHSFRHMHSRHISRNCKNVAELVAASQNLGHNDVLTTLRSYGQISREDQRRLITGEERDGDED